MERGNWRRKQNATENGIVGINDLPDEIICHILSFLPTEDSVRASFVSKRWKSFWSPLTVLDFDFDRFSKYSKDDDDDDGNFNQIKRFVAFVNRMILIHKGRHLDELRFALDAFALKDHCRSQLNKWILFLGTIDATTIHMDFLGIDTQDLYHPYNLPQYSTQHFPLPVMKYCFHGFPPVSRRIKLLKTILLIKVHLSKHKVYDLIHKCSVLEELHLIQCDIPSEFEFDAPNSKLKCLVLDLCKGREDIMCSIRINFPNLLKFKFVGVMLLFNNFSVKANLIETELKFNNVGICFDHCFMLRNLLADISTVNILTLCSCSLQILSIGDEQHKLLRHPLYNLKHLTLHAFLGEYELKGIACLLRSSPFLETLSINLGPTLFQSDEIWESQLVPIDCLRHLKRVEIKGFQGLSNEMGFVKYILKSALVLKEMIICEVAAKSPYILEKPINDYDEQLTLLQKGNPKKAVEDLLALKRASSDVKILLS